MYTCLGTPLSSMYRPTSPPRADDLVAVHLHIIGAELEPPHARDFTDRLLWNASEVAFTPEAFARITCREEQLPAQFEPAIARSIREAVDAERGKPPPFISRAPTECVVPLDVAAPCHGGIVLRDRVLWDLDSRARDAPRPESFAASLCADLSLPEEMVAPVALELRYQLQDAESERARGSVPLIEDDAPVVRTGRDVDEWSPSVELPEPTPATGDEEKLKHES